MRKLIFILVFALPICVFAKEDQKFHLEIRQCNSADLKNCKLLSQKLVDYHFKEILYPDRNEVPFELRQEILINDKLKLVNFGFLNPKVDHKKTVFIKTAKLQIVSGKEVFNSQNVIIEKPIEANFIGPGKTHFLVKISANEK